MSRRPGVPELTPMQVLVRAQAILHFRRKWIQGWVAGKRLPCGGYERRKIFDDDADCFCALAACVRAQPEFGPDWGYFGAKERLHEATRAMTLGTLKEVAKFNDLPTTTHDDIVRLFRLAIMFEALPY